MAGKETAHGSKLCGNRIKQYLLFDCLKKQAYNKERVMRKLHLLSIVILFLFIMSPLHADECMEGDCDNGFGTGFTEDNQVYEGEWQDGMPHGKGTLYIAKGKSVTGTWEKGELIKEEKAEEKKEEQAEEKP